MSQVQDGQLMTGRKSSINKSQGGLDGPLTYVLTLLHHLSNFSGRKLTVVAYIGLGRCTIMTKVYQVTDHS